jgi:amino acid adenylation domain-containing protein
MPTLAYDRTASILDVFARQAAARADAPAAMNGDRALTYAQLDARSDAMAARLVALGAGPGERVALLAERGLESLVATLAILKAGAAYAPIDLDYPAPAQAAMLTDAAARLALVSRAACVAATGATTLSLEEFYEASERRVAKPAPARGAGSAAYVMFTSGSTGRPKGVVVPDRAVCRLVLGQSYAPIGETDVLLHASPIAFDASTFEIWGGLLNGACVALLRAARPSVEEIVEVVRRHGVTVAWFTAGLFHLIAERGVERMTSLTRLMAGGDVVSPPHVERARAALARMTFVNGYGPTENTTFSCCFALAPGEPAPDGPTPIGPAIAHTTAHVVDDRFRRLADGETGELCVGGDGLAIGYLGQPELTAERFVVAPWGERLYRTGDLVTRDAGGAHRYHGRVDRQTKINGKRVELGAIEDALRRREGVEDAAMLVDERGASKRLVGVVKTRPGADAARIASAALDAMREAFPAAMLPARLVPVDALPLTANGKLDRAALLARADAAPARTAAAPGDAMESALAAIWAAILKRDAPPVDVNFFDLGATSLHIIAAQDAIRERLGVAVAVTALFEHGDIRSLARALREAAGEAPASTRHGAERDLLRARQRATALKELAARRAAGSSAPSHGGASR